MAKKSMWRPSSPTNRQADPLAQTVSPGSPDGPLSSEPLPSWPWQRDPSPSELEHANLHLRTGANPSMPTSSPNPRSPSSRPYNTNPSPQISITSYTVKSSQRRVSSSNLAQLSIPTDFCALADDWSRPTLSMKRAILLSSQDHTTCPPWLCTTSTLESNTRADISPLAWSGAVVSGS